MTTGSGAEERDHGAAILSALPFAREVLVQTMLNTEDICERRGEPELGEAGCEAVIIRRIGKGEVERVRTQLLGKAQRVGAMDDRLSSCPERVGVGANDLQARGCVLDEVDWRRAPRQCL